MDRETLERLVAHYAPSRDALRQLGDVTLVMTLGPSGVGKTTIMRASGLPLVLGDASRAPRIGERNGVDYWFRGEADMLRGARHGDYIQLALGSGGDLKGTKVGSFPAQGMATFAVVAAAIPTFRALPFARTYTAVIVPPTFDAWMQRIATHDLDEGERELRLGEAKQSLSFALQDQESHFVLNDDIPLAAERLRQVAAGGLPEREQLARLAAEQLLQGIMDVAAS